MLYSKNGSIPAPETDGTEGWVEVPDPPTPGEGEETVWWCPPGWIVRPIQPAPIEGHVWKWQQTTFEWASFPIPEPEPVPEPVVDETPLAEETAPAPE